MKEYVLCMAICLLSQLNLHSQSFTDDFESYEVGNYLGSSSDTWTTWSGNTGGSEDVVINDDKAMSGEKSIYFSSNSSGGGPQDVILPFGAKYSSGTFNYKMAMYVEEDANAYFNFQREMNVGSVWAFNANFDENGLATFDDGIAVMGTSSYPMAVWFTIEIDINLTANIWNILIDDECVSSFASGRNAIASIDIFPLSGSRFYIDDVSFSHSDRANEVTLDAGLDNVIIYNRTIVGETSVIGASLVNNGIVVIESADVSFSDGNQNGQESFTNLNLQTGESFDFDFTNLYSFDEIEDNIVVTLDNINGESADGNYCNNSSSSFFFPAVPKANKKVVIEEATGTWCQWCPRGSVFMEAMNERYPEYFIGIAVHNGDPMTLSEYDDASGFNSFPNSTAMRATEQDPSFIENPILRNISEPASASMLVGSEFNEDTRDLSISVVTEYMSDIESDMRLSVVLTENGVTGSSNGYNQVNAFAGGNNGPMGGYENLPNPVPASMMVYDFVARALLGTYDGQELNSIGAKQGDKKTLNFEYSIPQGFDVTNMHLIALLLDEDGVINNGEKVSFDQALDNGLVVTSTQDPVVANNTYIYPNPVNDVINIELDIKSSSKVVFHIYNGIGQRVANKNYGKQVGHLLFPIETSFMDNGIYYVHIYVDDAFASKKIVVSK